MLGQPVDGIEIGATAAFRTTLAGTLADGTGAVSSLGNNGGHRIGLRALDLAVTARSIIAFGSRCAP